MILIPKILFKSHSERSEWRERSACPAARRAKSGFRRRGIYWTYKDFFPL